MGRVKKEIMKHDIRIRTGITDIHRDQGIVQRFNRTFSKRLFSFIYSQKMNMKSSEGSREWVKRLPEVVTRLTGKKPVDGIRERVADAKSSTSYSRVVGLKEKRLDSSVNARYLYKDGELEGGKKRATDPNWSLKVYTIDRSIVKIGEPVLYYLKDGPGRGFVREELMVVPRDTQRCLLRCLLCELK